MTKSGREGTCEAARVAAELGLTLEGAAECNEPIEARRVCRKHYYAIRKVDGWKKLQQSSADSSASSSARRSRRGSGSSSAAQTNGDSSGGKTRNAGSETLLVEQDRSASDNGRKRVARVTDVDCYQDYPQSEKDVRKKDMKAGLVWKGRALVDMEAGERAELLTVSEISERHDARVEAFGAAEAERQGKDWEALKSELGRSEAICHLIYCNEHFPAASDRFAREVIDENAGDWRERGGRDRVHSRRNKELRSIDLPKAGRKIGLEEPINLGDDDVLRAIVDAIEYGEVKS